jgi:hypothetical protein
MLPPSPHEGRVTEEKRMGGWKVDPTWVEENDKNAHPMR